MFISVNYVLEADEFARGVVAAFRRWLGINQAIGVFCDLPVVALYLIHPAQHASLPDAVLVAVLAVISLYLILLPLIRRLVLTGQYRKRKVGSVHLVFTGDGVTWNIATDGCEHHSVVRWDQFAKIRETAEFFLIYPSRRRVNVVPKRAFSPEQAALFSRFVEYGFAETLSAM